MLKNFEYAKTEDKAKLSREIKELRARLVAQQQQVRAGKLPVFVLIEGWSAAGEGSLIKELISEMDPRFYRVISPAIIPENEARYPFLYPFASAIPCPRNPAGPSGGPPVPSCRCAGRFSVRDIRRPAAGVQTH